MIIWSFVRFLGLTLALVLGQDPIVNLPQGRIVGIKVYMENSVTPIEIFFGIPYAMAPTGRLRFSSPEKHTGWRRTFYAHRMPLRCPQPGMNGTDFSEDCLFLNIWTSRSIAARGNLAILDQYLALVWIRENIAAFGGDPSSVTLAGHSAGANSVLHHILSPRPAGLFHRAIIMSPRDTWKLLDKKSRVNSSEMDKISREVAKHLGCSIKSDQEILQCMRAHPVSDILNFESTENILEDFFQPIAEDFLPESEQYLPSLPSKILSTSLYPNNIQLDLLLGNTNLEVINYMDNTKYRQLMQQNSNTVFEYAKTTIIPGILKILSLDRSEAFMTLTQAIGWEYWNSNLITNTKEAVEFVASMESSAKWSAGEATIAARLANRISRLYVYRYSQPSAVDLTGTRYNFTGAVHGADLIALLGDALMLQVARRPASKSEKRISLIFRKYIVNFIKFGAPGSQDEWPRYVSEYPNVHEICYIDEADINCNKRSTNRDMIFWLQYLPQLTNSVLNTEQSQQLNSGEDESRLRGGVLAMCGVSITLLLLLCISMILLHRGRTYRASISDDGTHL